MCGERPDNEMTATEGTRRPTPDAEAWGGDARMLRDTADRYQALVTATAQIVWTAHPDGRLDDLRGWRAYTGQSAAEAVGWGWLEAIHPHDQERITHAWSEARAAGVLYEVEARLRRSDGVYRRFLVRGVPILDAEGGIREWVGVCTAITTHARSAAALEAILDTALDAIVTMDHQGRIVEFNPAAERIFGYSRADALDHALADLIVPPDLRARHRAGLTALCWPISPSAHDLIDAINVRICTCANARLVQASCEVSALLTRPA
jgi:PAS domain S-box-containing protein